MLIFRVKFDTNVSFSRYPIKISESAVNSLKVIFFCTQVGLSTRQESNRRPVRINHFYRSLKVVSLLEFKKAKKIINHLSIRRNEVPEPPLQNNCIVKVIKAGAERKSSGQRFEPSSSMHSVEHQICTFINNYWISLVTSSLHISSHRIQERRDNLFVRDQIA